MTHNREDFGMTDLVASTELSELTTIEFTRYFRHLASRVKRAARSVTEEQLWLRPFPFGNSIGHLVLHLTGNLNHYIGALVAGTGYNRHREREFTDPVRCSLDELLTGFNGRSIWSFGPSNVRTVPRSPSR